MSSVFPRLPHAPLASKTRVEGIWLERREFEEDGTLASTLDAERTAPIADALRDGRSLAMETRLTDGRRPALALLGGENTRRTLAFTAFDACRDALSAMEERRLYDASDVRRLPFERVPRNDEPGWHSAVEPWDVLSPDRPLCSLHLEYSGDTSSRSVSFAWVPMRALVADAGDDDALWITVLGPRDRPDSATAVARQRLRIGKRAFEVFRRAAPDQATFRVSSEDAGELLDSLLRGDAVDFAVGFEDRSRFEFTREARRDSRRELDAAR